MSSFQQGYIDAKRKQREELAQQVTDYIQGGGDIQQVPVGTCAGQEASE